MPRNIMSFDELSKNIDSLSNAKKFKKEADPRFYNLKFDDQGHGNAIIRFLPPKIGEASPIVKKAEHFFKGQNGWFVEPCPRTIGNKCPVCEHVYSHWEKGTQNPMSARVKFYANILVVKDPLAPENEGKVFLLRFGKDIFNMIAEKINPTSDIDEKVNIFDYEHGMNFKLKATLKNIPGFSKAVPNYRECSFMPSGPVVVSDKQVTSDFIDSLDEKIYSLKEFTDPSKFKSYDELLAKFKSDANILMDDAPSSPEPTSSASVNEFANGEDTMGDNFFESL